LKRAIASLIQQIAAKAPGACPIVVSRDEILVECAADQAEAVVAWLRQAMLDGVVALRRRVPVVVAIGSGRTWADAAGRPGA
jgi:DNA polymerase I-like protein with 3'-5' exonuclease and polymerase domains